MSVHEDGGAAMEDDYDDEDESCCMDCGMLNDECECHYGAECGRWSNGRLTGSCHKAGSEECDFECPFRDTLYSPASLAARTPGETA